MKYLIKPSIISAAVLLAACQNAPERQAFEITQDPIVAEAGWKVGQVYKTLKRGGVTSLDGSYYCLDDETGDARVRKSWQIPNYKDKWFAYKVPPGSLFKVTTIEYGGIGDYQINAVHLPDNQLGTSIMLNTFGDMKTIRGGTWNRWIPVRDESYLVPAQMSKEYQPNSTNSKSNE